MSLKQSAGIEAKLARAKTFAQTWRKVDPNLGLDDLTLKNYDDTVTDLETEYMQLVGQETALENSREVIGKLTDVTDDNEIRLRALAKIKFGADSMQFGQLGGTRTSDRKKNKGRPLKNKDKSASIKPDSTGE